MGPGSCTWLLVCTAVTSELMVIDARDSSLACSAIVACMPAQISISATYKVVNLSIKIWKTDPPLMKKLLLGETPSTRLCTKSVTVVDGSNFDGAE